MADTQYVIDIASQLSGADATSAELDALASKLNGSGARAAVFDDALAQLSGQLDGAAAAAAKANSALADGQAEYDQLERAAQKAAKAAERLQHSGDASKLARAQAAADSSARAVREYAGELDRLEREAAQATSAQQKLGRTMSNVTRVQKRVRDNLGDAATKLSTFRGALGDVGGPLGELGEKMLFPAQAAVDLTEWFGKGTAAAVVLGVGLAAVTAALVALTAAFAAGVVSVTAWAVRMGDARRGAELAQEAFEALHPELTGVSSGFARLTSDTGLAADQLRGLATQLQVAKVAATDMPAALRAVSLAEAALGSGQGMAFFNRQVKGGKASIDDFAAAAQSKFGNIVARQMLGLEAQGARFRRNISDLFGDLEIEPVLRGMSTLVDLFDENTAAGRAMKSAFTAVFQPIIDQVQNAAYVVEAFALGFLIGMTRIWIAVKPAARAVLDFLGIELGEWELADVLKIAAKAGEALAPILVGVMLAIGALGAAIAVLVAGPIATVLMAGAAMGVALYAVAAAVVWLTAKSFEAGMAIGEALVGGVTTALDALQGFATSAVQVGTDLIMGLVQGITAASGALVSAVTGAVGGAIGAAKRQLGIASPSRVFAEIGGATGEGFVAGIEGESASAHRALEDMIAPPQLGSSGSQHSTSNTTHNTTTNNGGGLTFVYQGKGGREDFEEFREAATRWIEGLALQGAGA